MLEHDARAHSSVSPSRAPLPVAARAGLPNNRAVPRLSCVRIQAFAAAFLIAAAVPVATTPASSQLPLVLISRQLAEREHLRAGDIVTLALDADGSGARRFQVGGTYEPTPDPLRFTAKRFEAHVHLPDLVAMTAAPADPGRWRHGPLECSSARPFARETGRIRSPCSSVFTSPSRP
jgi:hypothetical protein